MSQNCVDATIEIANEHDIPIFLIASRRQIEAECFGGGYVNNWSTESFARYVQSKDKKGRIILARDHGGPWQNQREIAEKYDLRRAMESAKLSYKADIESGFNMIHIDPSIDPYGTPTIDAVLDRVYELYDYCCQVARESKKAISFEIGTEEQSESNDSLEIFEYSIRKVKEFCTAQRLPHPTFAVAQTGSKVVETRNIGVLASGARVEGRIPPEVQIPRIIELCERYGVLLKEHNTDYLSDEILAWHPKVGIHAANVAPEFGVAESRALVDLLRSHNLESLADSFCEMAYESAKWKKWMVPDTSATKFDKAIIAGHYIFATPNFRELKSMAQEKIGNSINIDEHLKKSVKDSIHRYVRHFYMAG